MFPRKNTDEDVISQAAMWSDELRGGELSDEGREQFQDWWLADVRHARELQRQNKMRDIIAELPASLRDDLFKLAEKPEKYGFLWGLTTGPRLAVAASVAAAILLASVAGWHRVLPATVAGLWSQSYKSVVGERRVQALPDGSTLSLNTQTSLAWIGSVSGERTIRFESGEAFFSVVPDARHPFRILLGHSEIRVLGTEFDVYCKPNGDVLVTVLKGAVSVEDFVTGSSTPAWQKTVAANEQIEYSPSGLISDVHPADAMKVALWRLGLMDAQGRPLSNIVSDLNRYTSKRIEIADPRASVLPIGGTFKIDEIRDTLMTIQKLVPISITDTGGAYILNYRSDADGADVVNRRAERP